MTPDPRTLSTLPKSDGRKVILAMLLREMTLVRNAWIADHLCMGHPGSVSRSISAARKDRKLLGERDDLRGKLGAGE
jgi:hypothetical protein